jgi:hypothetical protein
MRKCDVRFLVFVCAAVVLAGAGPGVLGSTLVYENWDANAIGGYYAPTMEFLRIADDMNLAGTERILDHYDFAIYVTAGTAPYTVTSELYTDDPIAGTPNTPIPGTSCVHMVNADGHVVLDCAPGTGAILPDRVWMVLTLLTESNLGWMIAEAAETGYTDDVFAMEDPILGWELYWFGGPPDPYAGFEANIWCRKPPVPNLKWSQPPVEIDPNSGSGRFPLSRYDAGNVGSLVGLALRLGRFRAAAGRRAERLANRVLVQYSCWRRYHLQPPERIAVAD